LEQAQSALAKEISMTGTAVTDLNDPTSNETEQAQPISNGKTALTDDFRSHFAGDAPLTEKAKGFAKARPWTSAALVGVAAIALLNTLRGR
jgi:hypothetical protein